MSGFSSMLATVAMTIREIRSPLVRTKRKPSQLGEILPRRAPHQPAVSEDLVVASAESRRTRFVLCVGARRDSERHENCRQEKGCCVQQQDVGGAPNRH